MNLMIDIETLSLQTNARILSIGACFFDSTGIKGSTYMNVSTVDTYRFHEDQATKDWWAAQSDEAKAVLNTGHKLHIVDALNNLSSYIKEGEVFSGEELQIWANDPSFDCSILRHAYDILGLKCPWKFWQERAFRTVVALAESKQQDFQRIKPIIAHSAVDDAVAQAETVISAFKVLGIN